MNPFVITLILCSTFMHAGWNLLARRQRSELIFFNRLLAAVVILGFAPAVLSEVLTPSLTSRAWACVIGSGVFAALYFFALARAYGSSDFTVVYPVARSLPVLFVALGDVLRGRYPTTIGWLGISLVVCGCFFAPLHSFRGFSLRRYFNRASLWMLITALGTVGYTLLDKIAAENIQQGPVTAAVYGCMFFSLTWIFYLLFLHVFRSREEKKISDSVGWKLPVVAGILNFGGYWLILWAYQLSEHASYIVAFRQFSIVIGVILAFLIYREKGLAVRLAGTFLLTLGLILIGLWGG